MRQMLRVVWVLLLSAAVSYAPAQTLQSTRSEAERQHNLRKCLSGRYLCDHSLLRGEEAAKVREAETKYTSRSSRVEGIWSTRSVPLLADQSDRARVSGELPGPGCAENGSCYGEISETTGHPKTVYVRGYFRKDGTYVRSHYRSPPNSSGTSISLPKIAEPGCAENGGCYGDISPITSRPKTVHVRGYYRKDGTYVRGHYRSRPRR